MDCFVYETDNRDIAQKLYDYLRNKSYRRELISGKKKEYAIYYTIASKNVKTIDKYIDKLEQAVQ